ncbi:hypothetical protein DFH11DRAFT_1629212 [Phellopilus nigrolimitatus]|nr:hypothetical protein DFH11DRAFT_1629212 [Phellopilus nigrolimitatus]
MTRSARLLSPLAGLFAFSLPWDVAFSGLPGIVRGLTVLLATRSVNTSRPPMRLQARLSMCSVLRDCSSYRALGVSGHPCYSHTFL